MIPPYIYSHVISYIYIVLYSDTDSQSVYIHIYIIYIRHIYIHTPNNLYMMFYSINHKLFNDAAYFLTNVDINIRPHPRPGG